MPVEPGRVWIWCVVKSNVRTVEAGSPAEPPIAFGISDVGDPLFVFRETRELCGNPPKKGLELLGFQVVPRQLTTESLTDYEQFLPVFAGKKRLQEQRARSELNRLGYGTDEVAV